MIFVSIYLRQKLNYDHSFKIIWVTSFSLKTKEQTRAESNKC